MQPEVAQRRHPRVGGRAGPWSRAPESLRSRCSDRHGRWRGAVRRGSVRRRGSRPCAPRWRRCRARRARGSVGPRATARAGAPVAARRRPSPRRHASSKTENVESPSPLLWMSTPPLSPTARPISVSCRSISAPALPGCSSHSRVDPSTSVIRKVTVLVDGDRLASPGTASSPLARATLESTVRTCSSVLGRTAVRHALALMPRIGRGNRFTVPNIAHAFGQAPDSGAGPSNSTGPDDRRPCSTGCYADGDESGDKPTGAAQPEWRDHAGA